MLVIQVEIAFDHDDISQMPEAMRDGLDSFRQYATARVVGSYELPGKIQDNDEWYARATSSITMSQPVTVDLDV